MIYLHIGCHKTGTSTIQRFLAQNRARLEEVGYRVLMSAPDGTYHALAKPFLDPEATLDSLQQNDTVRSFLAEADATTQSIIVSSENFDSVPRMQLPNLAAVLGDRPVKVIVYLRRQEEIIPSAYLQQVKTGVTRLSFDEWFHHFIGRPRANKHNVRFNYMKLLSLWSEAGFKLAPALFLRADWHRGDLVDDFLHRIGVDDDALTAFERVPSENISPGARAGVLCRELALRDESGDWNRLRQRLQRLEPAIVAAWADDRLRLLNAEQLEQCADIYRIPNRQVARSFFGRDNGRLFPSTPIEPAPPVQLDARHVQQVMKALATRENLPEPALIDEQDRDASIDALAAMLASLPMKRTPDAASVVAS